MNYRYKAFISYRHWTPDQEVAQKLHTYIENYGIPTALKKSLGIRKMGRVFRDQEELPLSANLGDDIHEALEQSEWLICVCSPRYLQSRWCQEELRYFLSLGRRDRVLTLLAEGEPEEAFPEELRYREENGKQIAVEPLAADVRGATVAENLKKLKNEKLRILAPMLGVRYDDLRQRARQRRNRITMAAGAAVILLLSGFLGYAFMKNSQISGERNAALASQSKYLAKEADGLLERGGDRMLAMLLAREALPKDFDHPDRPVTEEAAAAMRSAMATGTSNRYTTVTDLNIGIRSFGSNGATLAVCSDDAGGYLTCFDMATGREKEYLWKLERRPELLEFAEDLMSFFYTDDTGVHRAYRMGNENRKATVYDGPGSTSGHLLEMDEKGSEFVIGTGYRIIAGPSLGLGMSACLIEEYAEKDNGEKEHLMAGTPVLFPAETAFETNDQYGTFLLMHITDDRHGDVSLLKVPLADTVTYSECAVYNYTIDNVNRNGEHVYGSTDHEDYPVSYAPSWDGKNIIALTYGGIYVWDTLSEDQVKAVSFTAFDGSRLAHMRVSSAGSRVAVTTDSGNLFLYDYSTGETTRLYTAGYKADRFSFNSDGSMLLCCDNERDTVLLVSAAGNTVQIIPADFDITDAAYAHRDFRGNGKSDHFLLLRGEKKARLMRMDSVQERDMILQIDERSLVTGKAVLSTDGTKLWYYRSENLMFELTILDLETGERTTVDTFENKLPFSYCNSLHRIGDRYIARSGKDYETDRSVIILYDVNTGEKLRELHPSATGTDMYEKEITDSSSKLDCVYEDGEYAVFSAGRNLFYVYDAETMEEKYSQLTDKPTYDLEFYAEGGYLLTYNRNNAVLYTQVISTETWQAETPIRSSGCRRFCGMLHHAKVTGFSDLISVYQDGKVRLMDLRSGEETILDLYDVNGAVLNRDRTGIILRTSHAGDNWYLYDGKTVEPYIPAPEETSGMIGEKEKREPVYRFLDRLVYQAEGRMTDVETGTEILNSRNRSLEVLYDCREGNRMLLRDAENAKLYLLQCVDGNRMLEMANTVLDGREMTDEQRRMFFLE